MQFLKAPLTDDSIDEAKGFIFDLTEEQLADFYARVQREYHGVNREEHLEDLAAAINAKTKLAKFQQQQDLWKAMEQAGEEQ